MAKREIAKKVEVEYENGVRRKTIVSKQPKRDYLWASMTMNKSQRNTVDDGTFQWLDGIQTHTYT